MNPCKTLEDTTVNIHADLIERCKKDDPIAQYKVYKLYSKAMYNSALRIIGSTEDAEDVLQESFVSAFRGISNYRGDAAFGAWLKRIVINKSISFLKKVKKEFFVMMDDQAEYLSESAEDEHYPVSVEEIRKAVLELPAGFRSVLTLYLFEGYDHQEISSILEISESTSKTQYKRAKDRLKKMLMNDVKYG